MKVAFDDNLGIPKGFDERFGCELVSYHELADMAAAFSGGAVSAMFAPCGLLPYLECPYEILAQATFGEDRRQHLESRFIVSDRSTLDEQVLVQGSVGCVNRYCTTSYWAPMIASLERTPLGTPIHFCQAKGFDDMLFSVADGRADAAMVWDAVLNRQPAAASKTRELFRFDQLPTPAIVSNTTLDPQRSRDLKAALASYATDSHGFFNGFASPDTSHIAEFLERDALARKHYRIAPMQQLGDGRHRTVSTPDRRT